MTLLKGGIIGASLVFLLAGSAYLKYQKDQARCSISDIQRGGTLETDTKHDVWFDRNINGEVWLRNDETYCQIR